MYSECALCTLVMCSVQFVMYSVLYVLYSVQSTLCYVYSPLPEYYSCGDVQRQGGDETEHQEAGPVHPTLSKHIYNTIL